MKYNNYVGCINKNFCSEVAFWEVALGCGVLNGGVSVKPKTSDDTVMGYGIIIDSL